MPAYAFLATRALKPADMRRDLNALSRVGVPYTKDDIARAKDDIRAQAEPEAGAGDLVTRSTKAQGRDCEGGLSQVTEKAAMIAHLELLSTRAYLEIGTHHQLSV